MSTLDIQNNKRQELSGFKDCCFGFDIQNVTTGKNAAAEDHFTQETAKLGGYTLVFMLLLQRHLDKRAKR